ncbi:hypothetical protein WR25_17274 [Diploscapter pachys]|uniref:Uncharacterized protein n=1 Tax=Diploscapter pachys TaxID=2018661 RepID=A0A2A2K892_9BILA|nr:hypothetical protein WR25_17274 [Diploscapter pachys]
MRPEAMVRVPHRLPSEAGDIALIQRIAPQHVIGGIDHRIAIARLTGKARRQGEHDAAAQDRAVRSPDIVGGRIGQVIPRPLPLRQECVGERHELCPCRIAFGQGDAIGGRQRDRPQRPDIGPARFAPQRCAMQRHAMQRLGQLWHLGRRVQLRGRPIALIVEVRVAIAAAAVKILCGIDIRVAHRRSVGLAGRHQAAMREGLVDHSPDPRALRGGGCQVQRGGGARRIQQPLLAILGGDGRQRGPVAIGHLVMRHATGIDAGQRHRPA